MAEPTPSPHVPAYLGMLLALSGILAVLIMGALLRNNTARERHLIAAAVGLALACFALAATFALVEL
jgi:hypothetical protein